MKVYIKNEDDGIQQLNQAISYFDNVVFQYTKDAVKMIPDDTLPFEYTEAFAKVWIGGGAVRDFFSIGKPKSDIDLFFPTKDDFNAIKKHLKKQGGKKIYSNDRTYKMSFKGRVFDLVKVFFESPELTISEFDFTVCCAAVTNDKLYYHDTFFIDLSRKRIVINSLPKPLSTFSRLQRYFNKGYWICRGGMLEISKALGK